MRYGSRFQNVILCLEPPKGGLVMSLGVIITVALLCGVIGIMEIVLQARWRDKESKE